MYKLSVGEYLGAVADEALRSPEFQLIRRRFILTQSTPTNELTQQPQTSEEGEA